MSNPALQPPPFNKPLTDKTGQVRDEEWQRYLLGLQTKINTGAAPANSFYWVSMSDGTLTNEVNLGALSSGYVKIAVAASTATPSSVATIPTSDLSGMFPAANLSGTIQAAQFPASLPAVNGAALTGLTETQIGYALVTKTGTYTVGSSDGTVLADATAGAFSVKLPATPTSGRRVTVKKIDSSANAVTIDGNGNNVDGAGTKTLAGQWNSRTVQSDGTNWFIVASV